MADCGKYFLCPYLSLFHKERLPESLNLTIDQFFLPGADLQKGLMCRLKMDTAE
jgi:hypothetical protein